MSKIQRGIVNDLSRLRLLKIVYEMSDFQLSGTIEGFIPKNEAKSFVAGMPIQVREWTIKSRIMSVEKLEIPIRINADSTVLTHVVHGILLNGERIVPTGSWTEGDAGFPVFVVTPYTGL